MAVRHAFLSQLLRGDAVNRQLLDLFLLYERALRRVQAILVNMAPLRQQKFCTADINASFRRNREASGQEKIQFFGRHGCSGIGIDEPEPSEIVVQKFCRNTIKTIHPILHATVEGVDVLNVINPLNNALFAFHV
jgi:hypothetical protein